ncbi:MAG: chemotaxis protein CheC [Candidatus Edwardsbacteria bacterium]|nr:chemotaxis protein CheC [Candidatus Edwardsbacteria bacterium]MBU1575786.1 chemotaxis protein CheC [Candidatus Edwardsbacteria bacterium]MBU2463997.1 chemotaxis protein CheC [Candidatus Edwardsbacteria bacterium]
MMKQLDNIQLDALKEVSNIGSGHAATALSELTGQKVTINIPVISIDPISSVFKKCADSGQKILGIRIDLSGDIVGRTLLFFSQDDALKFCDCLMRRPIGTVKALSELDRSGLREVSNILTCAYMNALGEMLNFMVVPTTPSLIIGTPEEMMAGFAEQAGGAEELAVIIENDFRFQGNETVLQGYFLLLPDDSSLQAMFKAMNIK